MLALARRLPDLRLRQAVVMIDPARRQLLTSSGAVLDWHYLVSTLPLDRLVAVLPDVPRAIRNAVASLEALPLAVVAVACDHPVDTPIQRIYSAGPEIPAHKIVINHNSSPYLRSLPRHGILAEVANPELGDVATGDLERQVVDGLCRMRLIRSRKEIVATKTCYIARAYPVPTTGRDAAVRLIAGWLAERSIFCVGRFGEWAYINSDEALNRGVTLGRNLLRYISRTQQSNEILRLFQRQSA
jgi:protoporphyrinogen oxidase